MIKIRFGLAVHDGWGMCEGKGETLEEAVRKAASRGGVDLEECREIEVDAVSIDGRDIEHHKILDALAKYPDLSDTSGLVALVRDYQVLRDVQDRAVPLLESLR